MSAIVLIGLYEGKQFIRVGYYINNCVLDKNGTSYTEEQLKQMKVNLSFDMIYRNILVNKPIMKKFTIPWESKQKENYLIQ